MFLFMEEGVTISNTMHTLNRSRNAFVDAYLGEEDGLDSFADLEDFIVCRPGTKYL